MGINLQYKRVIEHRLFNAIDGRAIAVANEDWDVVAKLDAYIEKSHSQLAKMH